MIKSLKGKVPNILEVPPIPQERARPADIIVDNYIIRRLSTGSSMDRAEMELAGILKETWSMGYKYLDRIQLNVGESILIFEKK